MNKGQYLTYAGAFVFLIAAGCAQQGNPTGGPKDEDPPVVLSSEPANYSNHFTAEKATITFDEYIVLDNVNQELIVSPPLEEKPIVKLKGKTLEIEIPGELHENTTYTFNFGNAIKDLHEGNKLQNFEYVFSTGETVDSLSIKGTLTYAFDLKSPKEPMYIMLYADFRDSVPITDLPFYVGKSDDEGKFSVNNLRPDVYKIFALKDANNNMKFDLPTEEIAFLDSNLIVSAAYFKSLIDAADSLRIDSLRSDTLEVVTTPATEPETEIAADSASLAVSDSLKAEYKKYNSVTIALSVFTEELQLQYLADYSRKDRRKLDMVFNRPLSDSFSVKALKKEDFPDNWFIRELSQNRDTVALWITDSLVFKRDSIKTVIAFMVPDSVGNPSTRTDTLLFVFRPPTAKSKKNQETTAKFSVRTIAKAGLQELNKNLVFNAPAPVIDPDPLKISFFTVVDSTDVPMKYDLVHDSIKQERVFMKVNWESAAEYHLFILPGAFTSIYGDSNDTMDVVFKTRDLEYYGNLEFNLNNVKGQIIAELYLGDKLFRSIITGESGVIKFDYLPPQKYRVKFIHDRNENGKWDTGKYLEKRQPEKVEWFSKEIEIRSNWDQSESYTLSD